MKDSVDENKLVFARLCVKALGLVVGSTREEGKRLGLSVQDTRDIWRKVLNITADGGGKYHDAVR